MQRELDFHNSIPIEGEELSEAKKKARTQQSVILEIFKRNPDKWFTPFDIQDSTGNDPDEPEERYQIITSIRRAITNLTNAGFLEKGTKEQQRDPGTGMKNNVWRIKP